MPYRSAKGRCGPGHRSPSTLSTTRKKTLKISCDRFLPLAFLAAVKPSLPTRWFPNATVPQTAHQMDPCASSVSMMPHPLLPLDAAASGVLCVLSCAMLDHTNACIRDRAKQTRAKQRPRFALDLKAVKPMKAGHQIHVEQKDRTKERKKKTERKMERSNRRQDTEERSVWGVPRKQPKKKRDQTTKQPNNQPNSRCLSKRWSFSSGQTSSACARFTVLTQQKALALFHPSRICIHMHMRANRKWRTKTHPLRQENP